MKIIKILRVFLIFCILFSPAYSYARDLTVNRILGQLTGPSRTSLQKISLADQYKGQLVKGAGRVRDILKSPGSQDTAMVRIQKPFGGKMYEIVMTVDRESVENIKKRQAIKFEGKFAGMTFDTIRLEEGKIIKKGWFF